MIININKPAGITSYDVIRILKKIFISPEKFQLSHKWQKVVDDYHNGKIGHGGTLDPFASGVLIVATDQDTKKINEIQSMPKQYIAGIKFGYISDTYDIDGNISPVHIQQSVWTNPKLSLRNIKKNLNSHFTGEILQTPPSFSAKKINGQRSYQLARAGISVKLPPKKVIIYNIVVNNYSYPDLGLTIECSTGTYIRSIAHDLGQKLGCGAYCHSLIRSKIGNFTLNNSLTLPTTI